MNKIILSILTSVVLFNAAYAQESNCPEPKKKALKYFEAAKSGSFAERKKLLYEAVKVDPNFLEAYDELANLSEKEAEKAFNNSNIRGFQQQDKIKLKHWMKINQICPDYRNQYFAMQIGDYYFSKRMFAEAKPFFQQVLSSPNAYKKDEKLAYERVQDIEGYEELISKTVPFKPEKVEGPSTGYDEYLPMLSPDNRYLFFTRKMPDEEKKAFEGDYKELFIQSRKTMGNNFSGGIPMGEPFNMGQYQGGVSVSVNNKLLFITIVDVIPYRGKDRAGFGQMFDNADIYFSEFKDNQWGKLESIGSHINTATTWESQPSISADNKTLYFSRVIDPFGGDIDIWKTERQPDGTWGEAQNLGAPINTPGDEKSPFMHSDSYTLYFSSNYHIGMGGYDIFYAKMDPETGVFQRPKNIGNPINTPKDEHGFIVSRDGERAYFGSSDEENLDLYSFELYEEARPKAVVFVNGAITNNLGEVPEGAQVTIKNTKTNQEVDAVIDQETGDYVAVVAVDKDEDIMLTAKKKGFAFSSQLISSDAVVVGKPIKTEKLEIKPIEVGETYKINDINFATNSFELNNRILLVLTEFINFLAENPTVKVAIHGHTDNVGDPSENMLLSENRAKAVYNYLVIEDIDPSRLSFKGFGETKPIAKNNTDQGRAKNRRTEFVIVGK